MEGHSHCSTTKSRPTWNEILEHSRTLEVERSSDGKSIVCLVFLAGSFTAFSFMLIMQAIQTKSLSTLLNTSCWCLKPVQWLHEVNVLTIMGFSPPLLHCTFCLLMTPSKTCFKTCCVWPGNLTLLF